MCVLVLGKLAEKLPPNRHICRYDQRERRNKQNKKLSTHQRVEDERFFHTAELPIIPLPCRNNILLPNRYWQITSRDCGSQKAPNHPYKWSLPERWSARWRHGSSLRANWDHPQIYRGSHARSCWSCWVKICGNDSRGMVCKNKTKKKTQTSQHPKINASSCPRDHVRDEYVSGREGFELLTTVTGNLYTREHWHRSR